MSDLVTEKELQEARLVGFTPGGHTVLKQLWWKELSKLTGAYGSLDVLHDFIDAMFYSLNNEHDKVKELPCLAGKDYDKRVRILQRAMRFLGEAMERERFVDLLGAADQELRGTKSQSSTGAFYTPDSLCNVMAELTGGKSDPVKAKLERGEIVTVYDPTVGAGRTLMAFCKQHADHLDQIRAFGTDIEINAVRMFFVNCALNGIAARCVHGNELSNEREWAVYYTPEWHVYEYDRNIKLQMDKWRALFNGMYDVAAEHAATTPQKAQETPEAIEPGNSTPKQENEPIEATGGYKADVTIEADGQMLFNF